MKMMFSMTKHMHWQSTNLIFELNAYDIYIRQLKMLYKLYTLRFSGSQKDCINNPLSATFMRHFTSTFSSFIVDIFNLFFFNSFYKASLRHLSQVTDVVQSWHALKHPNKEFFSSTITLDINIKFAVFCISSPLVARILWK